MVGQGKSRNIFNKSLGKHNALVNILKGKGTVNFNFKILEGKCTFNVIDDLTFSLNIYYSKEM